MGRVIEELGWDRRDIIVTTKIFFGTGRKETQNTRGLSRKHLIEGLAQSLKNLRLDYGEPERSWCFAILADILRQSTSSSLTGELQRSGPLQIRCKTFLANTLLDLTLLFPWRRLSVVSTGSSTVSWSATAVTVILTLIAEGKAFYWGTSEWNARQIQHAHDVAKRLNLIGPTCEQPHYSMLHRERFEVEYDPLFKYEGMGR